ncbi:PHP domain-containing protein [Candidatus Woesearchaeota archaeon]|nr:PHP domain-containing protein [Candidatus Woesearchaeota archaeon]
MASVIFKRPPIKKLKKDGLFGADMHFHTNYSPDGVARIRTAVKKAEKKGFGFAITDHNTVKGVISSYRQRKHALIIPGIEITCRNGNHLLAYFYAHREIEEFFDKQLRPRMKSNPFFINADINEIAELSKDYNCILCAPHPFAPGAMGMMSTGMTKNAENILELVEVINGFSFRKSNMKAIYWATKTGKGMTGGSDGHSTFELGKVLTFTHNADIENIFHDIKRNQSIVIGKEDNFFLKAVMSVGKESAYVKNSKKQKMAKQLIRSQMGTEYRYIREKFRNGKSDELLVHHHEMEKKE